MERGAFPEYASLMRLAMSTLMERAPFSISETWRRRMPRRAASTFRMMPSRAQPKQSVAWAGFRKDLSGGIQFLAVFIKRPGQLRKFQNTVDGLARALCAFNRHSETNISPCAGSLRFHARRDNDANFHNG
jgi:hypothetical protein